MRSRGCSIFLAALIVCVSGCATTSGHATTATSSRAIVERYLAALNRRDLLALTAYVTPDVAWYSVVGGRRILELTGREALDKSLAQFFQQHSRTQWTIESAQVVDRRVAVNERSEWNEGERMQSRSSLGVYELSDGRICRITYFLNDN